MKTTRNVDGVLLVDKPAGVTSHDVVLAARRATGESRIGHAGTLDPFATGLLVLLLGRATRLLPYLDAEPKVYEATIRFGAETDTDDLGGASVRTAPAPSRSAIDDAIPRLTGALEQVPPAFSAKRVAGRRAYELARAGEEVELRPARVRVHAWEILDFRGHELDVRITCGGGTYIRALARDLGRLTGSAAHLTALRRVASGTFRVGGAVTLDELRAGTAPVLAPRAAFPELPAESLSSDEINRVAQGNPVPARIAGQRAALVADDGALVAYAERDGDRWQPRVVMRRG